MRPQHKHTERDLLPPALAGPAEATVVGILFDARSREIEQHLAAKLNDACFESCAAYLEPIVRAAESAASVSDAVVKVRAGKRAYVRARVCLSCVYDGDGLTTVLTQALSVRSSPCCHPLSTVRPLRTTSAGST